MGRRRSFGAPYLQSPFQFVCTMSLDSRSYFSVTLAGLWMAKWTGKKGEKKPLDRSRHQAVAWLAPPNQWVWLKIERSEGIIPQVWVPMFFHLPIGQPIRGFLYFDPHPFLLGRPRREAMFVTLTGCLSHGQVASRWHSAHSRLQVPSSCPSGAVSGQGEEPGRPRGCGKGGTELSFK